MSNTVTLLAKQRAARLPHTALRRVRHRLCSVYTLTCATARLAKSERAGWERVSWRGPYAPLRLECYTGVKLPKSMHTPLGIVEQKTTGPQHGAPPVSASSSPAP